MLRAATLALDVAIVVLLLVVSAIFVTGGAEVSVAEHRLRLYSLDRPITTLAFFYALRVYLAPYEAVENWGTRTLRALHNWYVNLSPSGAHVAVMTIVLAATAIKLANAWFHPGFFSGDDVEIHEMTFAQLFDWQWQAWELRSAFFPMTFIYPVQALLAQSAVGDPATLVFSGRLVVVVISSISVVVLSRIAHRQYGAAVAVTAAFLFALSRLHVTFGSTELPRPISALFVIMAYGLLISSPSRSRALSAGACLGTAAALRFGEAVFVVPAVVMLVIDRQLTKATLVGLCAALVGLAVQFTSDALYWGTPFSSLRHMIDYTLIRGLSTRGYQPAGYYLTHFHEWTNAFVLVAAIIGARCGAWRAALWGVLPIAMLSALPHKEARYLIAAFPFVALLASIGLEEIVTTLADVQWRPGYRRAIGPAALVAFAFAVVYEATGMNFSKSDDGVRLAQILNARGDVHVLAAEQAWRLGNRLYLPSVREVRDLEYEILSRPEQLAAVITAPHVNWVAVLRSDCPDAPCRETILGSGYAPIRIQPLSESTYDVFRRSSARLGSAITTETGRAWHDAHIFR